MDAVVTELMKQVMTLQKQMTGFEDIHKKAMDELALRNTELVKRINAIPKMLQEATKGEKHIDQQTLRRTMSRSQAKRLIDLKEKHLG